MKVIAAREQYFARTGFSTASYDERWVHVKLGPLPFAFPNVASRRRAIRYHDLHHVVTGYDTTLRGEAEIGAWEIAATLGARGRMYWAAWLLNGSVALLGLVIAPRRTLRAFRRGRTCRSLYGTNLDEVLQLEVADVQRQLGLG